MSAIRMSMPLDQETIDKIKEVAEEQGRTFSSVVSKILNEAIADEEEVKEIKVKATKKIKIKRRKNG
jgi:predicted DNA-binding protein